MIAILAAGGYSLATKVKALQIAAFLVPVFIVCLRRYTIYTLDRYYLTFLESVTCTKKIVFILGLYGPLRLNKLAPRLVLDGPLPFESDEHFDVNRHFRDHLGPKRVKNSSDWIYNSMFEGHNNVVWNLFRAICISSAIIPLFGCIVKPTCPYILFAFLFIAIAFVVYKYDSSKIKKMRSEDVFGSSNEP